MQDIFTHRTTQYANYLESVIDDGDPVRLTYAQWFNTRRHVTEYPRRREYIWLDDEHQTPQATNEREI